MDFADVQALDRADPLAPLRDRFALPEGVIYLDGNSLGAMPRSVVARMAKTVSEEWGRDLITSWNVHDWIDLPRRVGDKIAPLIGAAPGTVVVAELHLGQHLQAAGGGGGQAAGPQGDPDGGRQLPDRRLYRRRRRAR